MPWTLTYGALISPFLDRVHAWELNDDDAVRWLGSVQAQGLVVTPSQILAVVVRYVPPGWLEKVLFETLFILDRDFRHNIGGRLGARRRLQAGDGCCNLQSSVISPLLVR
jgi:hypothetical protein